MKNFKAVLIAVISVIGSLVLLYFIMPLLPVNTVTAKLKSVLDKSANAIKSRFVKVSSSLGNFISGFEGYSANAYHDSIDPANVWTIGYGSVFNYDENRPVQKGDVVTKQKALDWLNKEAELKFDDVSAVVNVDLTDNQLVALSSFAYQFGVDAFNKSTLLRLLNTGEDKVTVANQFDRWIYSNGKVVNGIKKRMAITKKLFLS